MPEAALPLLADALTAVRDHSRVYQEFLHVYPVLSRRSRGLSIGLNLNPDKRCNFDCVYCEVDRGAPPRTRALDLAVLRDELDFLIEHALSGRLAKEEKFAEAPELAREIRDLAFSGDGEPTMVANFDECVQVAVDARARFQLHQARIVLITDAAGLDKTAVRRGLTLMDRNHGEIWGKLDAGSEAYYRLVNRSHIFFDRILRNLTVAAQERPIVIQSLFLRVHGAVMPPAELDLYCARLRDLVNAGGRIKEVHAYTVARPTPEAWATRLDAAELESLAAVIRGRTGLSVLVFP